MRGRGRGGIEGRRRCGNFEEGREVERGLGGGGCLLAWWLRLVKFDLS